MKTLQNKINNIRKEETIMKYSKFLDKTFNSEETFEIEKEERIQELFNDCIENYNIVEVEAVVNKEDGEEKIYIINDSDSLSDSEIEEAIESGSYDYCYNHALYELEQFIWEGLYEFEENINEKWEDMEVVI